MHILGFTSITDENKPLTASENINNLDVVVV